METSDNHILQHIVEDKMEKSNSSIINTDSDTATLSGAKHVSTAAESTVTKPGPKLSMAPSPALLPSMIEAHALSVLALSGSRSVTCPPRLPSSLPSLPVWNKGAGVGSSRAGGPPLKHTKSCVPSANLVSKNQMSKCQSKCKMASDSSQAVLQGYYLAKSESDTNTTVVVPVYTKGGGKMSSKVHTKTALKGPVFQNKATTENKNTHNGQNDTGSSLPSKTHSNFSMLNGSNNSSVLHPSLLMPNFGCFTGIKHYKQGTETLNTKAFSQNPSELISGIENNRQKLVAKIENVDAEYTHSSAVLEQEEGVFVPEIVAEETEVIAAETNDNESDAQAHASQTDEYTWRNPPSADNSIHGVFSMDDMRRQANFFLPGLTNQSVRYFGDESQMVDMATGSDGMPTASENMVMKRAPWVSLMSQMSAHSAFLGSNNPILSLHKDGAQADGDIDRSAVNPHVVNLLPEGFPGMPAVMVPTDMVTVTVESPDTGAVSRDELKRLRDKQKKRELRNNPDFREKERQKALVRMKNRRQDPEYRTQERSKDKIRRRQARQENNELRDKERERDKVYKRIKRLKSLGMSVSLMPCEVGGEGEEGTASGGGDLLFQEGDSSDVGVSGLEGSTMGLEARDGLVLGEGGGGVTVMDTHPLGGLCVEGGDPPGSLEVYSEMEVKSEQGDEYG